jgi:16S rRNA (uracil1498-N3)-methyltransferase
MNWIILEESEKISEFTYLLKSLKSDHILFILKKTIGDDIRIILPNKLQGKAKIINSDPNSVLVELIVEDNLYFDKNSILSRTSIVLPLPRPQTGKKILHLAGCFGINDVNFLLPDSKNRQYLTSPVYSKSGLWKEIKTGMEQSGNYRIPSATLIHKSILDYFNSIENKNRITFDSNGIDSFYSLKQRESFNEITLDSSNIILTFGAESGFTEKEISFLNINSLVLNLGSTILRTEFAVCTALGVLQSKGS